ncbi:hypothetical protein [Sabulicella glaciei]|uniref:Uncharacterized protein n=1 Tax=Sabulicella glaciei TaxID=2984948 RepID=A0ABT3NRD8_9PROT|nr:hypothetical protein [Roseococcus sp. MDT2-1-1]MCW8084725.1 hypothetical protein [Roseococcus sp. MDT2-1-1]
MTAGFDARAALAQIRARRAEAEAARPVSSLRRISSEPDAFPASAAAPSPWPEGVDFVLTRDAARLSGYVAAGCRWRWCPSGSIELTKPDGLPWCLPPEMVIRLGAERLLPEVVTEAQP